MPTFARPAAEHYLRILLEPYASHGLVGQAIVPWLEGETDDGAMFGRIFGQHFDYLSSGEQATMHLALALFNGHREARVADLMVMDGAHRDRALAAITARFSDLVR